VRKPMDLLHLRTIGYSPVLIASQQLVEVKALAWERFDSGHRLISQGSQQSTHNTNKEAK